MKPIAIACLIAVCFFAAPAGADSVFAYREMCDASAAVALGRDHFVVADDERNTLQVYRRGQAAPVRALDLSAFLGTKPGKESDLEGAAAIGTRIYWIASHGRNSNAEVQERRHRFFATEADISAAPPSLRPVGSAYASLLDDLLAEKRLKAYKLKDAARLAPEAPGGLNIEGLAATPGGALLIGFRNPVRQGKALIVPLNNPAAVIAGHKAKFGTPMRLDLGGRGIRSIERVGASYLVVGGPIADDGSFVLFRWSGKAGGAAVPLPAIDSMSLHAEALFRIPGTNAVQILSDDGGVETEGVPCKKRPVAQQAFRSVTIQP